MTLPLKTFVWLDHLAFSLLFSSQKDSEKVNIDEAVICLSVASHISVTSEAIVIKLDTVTASVIRIQHVLIVLTLPFIQGHTNLNHENNKCLIISEVVQVYCECLIL